MDILELNESILNGKSVSEVLKNIIKKHPESTDLYNLCREMYENIYNSIRKIDGSFQSFLSEESIDNLVRNIEIFIRNNEIESNTQIFEEIIDVIRRYNIETATDEEKESRIHFVAANNNNGNFGKFGTLYDFNTYPDWDGLKKEMIQRFNN